MKKIFKVLIAAAALTAAVTFPAAAGQWQQDANGWWWQNDDGTYPEWTWAWIDADHDGIAENYYFDENGYLDMTPEVPGLAVNSDGALLHNGVLCTAQLPSGCDWYPGAAVDGKIIIAEFDRSDVSAKEAILEAERAAREAEKEPTYEEIDPYELAYKIIDLINEKRENNGKGTLKVNDELMENAMLRAEEASEFFSHKRPDGSDCSTAIEIPYSLMGENLAWEKFNTFEKVAESVSNGWFNSSGHKANMMNSRFEETGVGVYTGEDGIYIIQIFIKSRH